jgi:hypothetical protein
VYGAISFSPRIEGAQNLKHFEFAAAPVIYRRHRNQDSFRQLEEITDQQTSFPCKTVALLSTRPQPLAPNSWDLSIEAGEGYNSHRDTENRLPYNNIPCGIPLDDPNFEQRQKETAATILNSEQYSIEAA